MSTLWRLPARGPAPDGAAADAPAHQPAERSGSPGAQGQDQGQAHQRQQGGARTPCRRASHGSSAGRFVDIRLGGEQRGRLGGLSGPPSGERRS